MEILLALIFIFFLVLVFICCGYIPYRDESRFVKIELRRTSGSEHKYWKRRLFELKRNLFLSAFISVALFFAAAALFLFV